MNLYKKYKTFPASLIRSQFSLGFTLVELIVVVTILAILATIWFVSYSSYLTWVRDTNRLAQLVSIHDGLELYRTRNDLPLPDDNVEVQTNGTTIAYQWYVWSNTLETIDFTKGGKDPKDDQYFSYYLTKDRKYFQLLAFLEEEENITSKNFPLLERGGLGMSSTFAIDYSDRISTVYWKKLWILTDTDNTPIQDTITGTFDITSATTWYIAHMTDTVTLSWSALLSINPVASCKRIKQIKWGSQDGVYTVNPAGTGALEVYCDMTIDGWGWTRAVYFRTWDTIWDAYKNENNIESSLEDETFGLQISKFSSDIDGEDLEYILKVDKEQKWPVYTGVNKWTWDIDIWNSGSEYHDDSFYYKDVDDSRYTLCEGSGVRHANSAWNWSLADLQGAQCNGYGIWWKWFALVYNYRFSWLGIYLTDHDWTSIEIWIR